MKCFKETQISWPIIIMSIVIASYEIFEYINSDESKLASSMAELVFALPLLLIILLLFYGMRTIVYDDRVVILYGVGVIRRTFYLKNLEVGQVKKIPWWHGAGIRYYSEGTLYSINFTNAAEFKLKFREKSISIGSKNPKLLLDFVNKRLENLN